MRGIRMALEDVVCAPPFGEAAPLIEERIATSIDSSLGRSVSVEPSRSEPGSEARFFFFYTSKLRRRRDVGE
jgi:hypothetical protein